MPKESITEEVTNDKKFQPLCKVQKFSIVVILFSKGQFHDAIIASSVKCYKFEKKKKKKQNVAGPIHRYLYAHAEVYIWLHIT